MEKRQSHWEVWVVQRASNEWQCKNVRTLWRRLLFWVFSRWFLVSFELRCRSNKTRTPRRDMFHTKTYRYLTFATQVTICNSQCYSIELEFSDGKRWWNGWWWSTTRKRDFQSLASRTAASNRPVALRIFVSMFSPNLWRRRCALICTQLPR